MGDNPGPDRQPYAGDVYAEFISAEVREERSRKASLEHRGLSVVTSTGATLALFVAIATLGSDELPRPFPCVVSAALLIALIGAVAAATGGLVANLPRGYEEAATSALRRLTERELWASSSTETASRRVGELRVDVIDAARSMNDQKARAVAFALGAQVVAILALVAAVGYLLLSRT